MSYYIPRGLIEGRLWKDIFMPDSWDNAQCRALNGPNNTGKTTLVCRLAEQFRQARPAHAFCFFTTLFGKDSVDDYWIRLFREMGFTLTQEELEAAPGADAASVRSLLDSFARFRDDDAADLSRESLKRLTDGVFDRLNAIGVRIILIIDEFDRAQAMCRDGVFFNDLFNLSQKGHPGSIHSVLLISRRHLETIQVHTDAGSHLADAYPRLQLRGFANDELLLYFNSYKDLPGIVLDDQRKRDILYYCGRNPGLLMRMREDLLYAGPGQSIAGVFSDHRDNYTTTYRRMIRLMREERIGGPESETCYSVFLEEFFGPVTCANHAAQMQALHNRGFVTLSYRMDDDPDPEAPDRGLVLSNLYAIAGQEPDTKEAFYEPLSLFFLQYIVSEQLADDQGTLSAMLVNTELTLRNILRTWLSRKLGEDWAATLLSNFNPGKDKCFFLDTLRSEIRDNNASSRGITGSILDVISFQGYHSIIVMFGLDATLLKYLRAPSRNEMAFLTRCRNLNAHLNLPVLSHASVLRLREDCAALQKGCQEQQADMDADPFFW